MNQRIEDFFKYCDGSGFVNVYSTNFYIQRPDKIKALAKIQEVDIKIDTEIKYLLSKIELLKLYRAELFNRFQEINAVNFHLRVMIDRQRQYYENKVFYYITVDKIPDRADVAPVLILCEKFNGKERHTALKRFEELCKQYPQAEQSKKIEKSQWE